jgi:glycosyltransferase involved in cell wall biosynthesis
MPDVVLPVLDEAAALPVVLAALPSGYEPIVVDNGSTDGSAEIARDLGARVVHEVQRGFGAACHAGLLASDAEIVCFMDCDGSLDPSQLPLVADPVADGDADLVLGARDHRPGSSSWHARSANAFLARRIRARTGYQLSDLGPTRAARREGLLELDLRDRRCGYPLEMVLRAAARGWRVREVSVAYAPRIGASKITGTVRGSMTAVRDMTAIMRTAPEAAR